MSPSGCLGAVCWKTTAQCHPALEKRSEYHRFMAFLGLFEAVTLSPYSVGRIAFSPTTLLQGSIALVLGAGFAIAYGLGFAFRARSRGR